MDKPVSGTTIQDSTEPVAEVPTQDWTPVHPLDTAEEDGGWLPAFAQMRAAALLQIELAAGPDAAGVPFHRGLHSSMRQGFGLVGVIALVAMLPMTLAVWFWKGVSLPVAPLALLTAALAGDWSSVAQLAFAGAEGATWANRVEGAPWLWALGAWLGAPIRFWTLWLVGGLLVFGFARLIGARNTLPRIFATTGYAFLPLLLLVFMPIPTVGMIAMIVALVLFVLAYVQGVRAATQMEWGHVLIAILAPTILCNILLVFFPALLFVL